MDKNQKSAENVGLSRSNSSRRVMWRVSEGEEEVYESIVNYRSLSPTCKSKNSSESNSEHDLPSTSNPKRLGSADEKFQALNKEGPATKSSTSLAMRYKPSHESLKDLASASRARAIGHWHHLFGRIRNKKQSGGESPNLALRYRPSHESLKIRRSKDQFAERSAHKLTNSPKPKHATADLKMEMCVIPPYQTAVVREVAPKFATRMCLRTDSDSCCSDSIELRIPLLKPSEFSKITCSEITSLVDHKGLQGDSAKSKRRTKPTSNPNCCTPKTNSSKNKSSGTTNNNLPTLRQRQQELYRIRMQIEKRRLELLDLKIIRERADALRHEILFHKDLQLKHSQIKAFEDNNSSQA